MHGFGGRPALPTPPDPAGPPVRDAATVILVRRDPDGPAGADGPARRRAAFMPDKFVFPGGAVDPEDGLAAGSAGARAADRAPAGAGDAAGAGRGLALAAVRELWEETGLMLGLPDPAAPGAGGAGVVAGVLRARLGAERGGAALRVPRHHPARPTPAVRRPLLPGRGGRHRRRQPRGLGEELAHLQWLDLAAARALPLPFITEVVLSEVEALLVDPDPARPVPFFHQTPEGPRFRLL